MLDYISLVIAPLYHNQQIIFLHTPRLLPALSPITLRSLPAQSPITPRSLPAQSPLNPCLISAESPLSPCSIPEHSPPNPRSLPAQSTLNPHSIPRIVWTPWRAPVSPSGSRRWIMRTRMCHGERMRTRMLCACTSAVRRSMESFCGDSGMRRTVNPWPRCLTDQISQ